MAEVGEEWMWLVYRCSHFGGGGGSSTFNAKQCCASESPFFLQSERVSIKPLAFSRCVSSSIFIQYLSFATFYLVRPSHFDTSKDTKLKLFAD